MEKENEKLMRCIKIIYDDMEVVKKDNEELNLKLKERKTSDDNIFRGMPNHHSA